MTFDPSSPPRPSALLFDLDGTLIDSRRDIAAACNEARVTHGFAPLPLEKIVGMIGDGARALVARAFDVAEDDPLARAALVTFNASYVANPCVHTMLLPGVREVLESAAAAELPCAVVTNKPREISRTILAAIGISPYFKLIWGGGDGPLKPAPDSVRSVIERLDVHTSSAWMIGDGPQDIGAGKAAGCFTVGVPGIAERERLVASAPDLIVESLLELRDLFESLVPPFRADRDGPRPL